VYKPRAGKAHGNKDKFNKEQLAYMRDLCPDLLKKFGYYDLFNLEETGELDITTDWIEENNKKALKMSMTNFFEKENETIYRVNINMRRLLLRPTSLWYPEGRLTAKFKSMLQKKVTIVDKSGKVVREPTMDALKAFHEDPVKNESDCDEENGEIRGETNIAEEEKKEEE
jgi:hypothetical protein